MTKYILTVSLLIGFKMYSLTGFCQNNVAKYEAFDIKSSSCQMLNVVNVELGKAPYDKDFQRLQMQKQIAYPLQTSDNIETYIKDFNDALDKTRKRYDAQELIWKTEKELKKYGLSVLGNYAQALPSKHLTAFLTPAIQQGYELYVDNEISKAIEEHKDVIDKIIMDRINLLYSNGIDVTKSNDEEAFNSIFALAHGDIPALKGEHNGIFARELTKKAYDFIAKNRAELKLVNLKTDQQYEQVKQEVNIKLQTFQNQIDSRFKELGNSIARLVNDQASIFKILKNIQTRIEVNEGKISKLEKEMVQVQNDITNLQIKQHEHDRLLAQNAFQIDILSGYAFQNLNTKQKIEGLSKGHFNNIFRDPSERKQLLNELKEIRQKETIISVANDVENYSKAAYGGLVNAGIFKGKDAQNVGKFISGISVLSGIARVYAGDASGLVSIVTGLGGLFGKPQISPEMQMMRQMCDYMEVGFNQIDNHLNRIEIKVDSLTNLTFRMYKAMLLSFQYTGNQLDKIDRKINYLQYQSSHMIFKEYKKCIDQSYIWRTRKTSFNSYSDVIQNYSPECRKCLDGLDDFLSGEGVHVPFFVSSNEKYKNVDVIDREVDEIYAPTKMLFQSYYDDNRFKSLYALLFPFASIRHTSKPLYYTKEINDPEFILPELALDHYYNYELINSAADYLLEFSLFYETADNKADFIPQSFESILVNNTINGNNNLSQEQRLLKLLNLIQYAIMQQSMLAGNLLLDPIYFSLFGYSTNENEIDLSIRVLNNNKLLASNFATYMITKNLNFTDTLKWESLFNKVLSDSKKLDSMNSLIEVDDFKFIVDNTDKNIYISFARKEQSVKILCPTFATILRKEMINSGSIYSLLDCRYNILSKLSDLTFTRKLKTDIQLDRFKYWYSPSEN